MVAAPAIAEVIEQESLIPRNLQFKWPWIGVYFSFWGRPLTTHGEQSHVPELFFKYYIWAILKRLPTPLTFYHLWDLQYVMYQINMLYILNLHNVLCPMIS